MKRAFSGCTAVLATALLAGCGTVTHGTSQDVFVVTTPVTGAACTASNSKGSWAGITPATITVTRDESPLNVVCTKDGRAFGQARFKSGMSYGQAADAVAGTWAILPAIDEAGTTMTVMTGSAFTILPTTLVDRYTGAAFAYPKIIAVHPPQTGTIAEYDFGSSNNRIMPMDHGKPE